MALIFAIGALMIWYRDPRQKHLLGFVAASLAIGLSFIFNHYLPLPSVIVSRMTVAFLSMGACIALLWAAVTRLEQPAPLGIWIAGAIGTAGLMLLADPEKDMSAWLLGLNVYCGVVFVMGTQILVFAKSNQPVDRAMIWVFALIAVQFFARPIAVIMIEGEMTSAEYRHSVGHAIYMVVGAVGKLMLACVILAAAIIDQFKAFKDTTETDSLSGLALRNAFEEGADEMLARASVVDVPVSVILADIDHFKRVNDLWGHPAGDKVIAKFGQVFLRTIRPTDLAGRIGGEEFCVLVWNCPEEAAANLAERLRIQFAREKHEGIEPSISLTSSFGVAACKPGEPYLRAYERADAALYRAKRAGRNRVVSNALGHITDGSGEAVVERRANTESASTECNGAEVVPIADVKAALRETG